MGSRYQLSVVAPCLDEEVNIPILAERLFAATSALDIVTELVLVDDGSTDGTWEVIEGLRDRYGDHVAGVRHGVNRGIAASWRSGVATATAPYVCLIDAD